MAKAKMHRKTNNGLQNNEQKTKDCAIRTPLKLGINLRAPKWFVVPTSLATTVFGIKYSATAKNVLLETVKCYRSDSFNSNLLCSENILHGLNKLA